MHTTYWLGTLFPFANVFPFFFYLRLSSVPELGQSMHNIRKLQTCERLLLLAWFFTIIPLSIADIFKLGQVDFEVYLYQHGPETWWEKSRIGNRTSANFVVIGKFSFTPKMCCDLRKPVTSCTGWNCKMKEINIIILMFFFIFYSIWTSVTFDTNIRGDPSKKFWKENNSNFHMIPITQNINFAARDWFSQTTSHICGPVPQTSRKVGPWPIWFYYKFRNFISVEFSTSWHVS